ncbi:MAG: resolvase [Proteobacteria bacterium]|nr:MAG: resolvase [Pseudomonadota bacterium]
MTTYFAYLRVSTTQQDLENQKLGVLEYANQKKFAPLKIVTDEISARVGWRERNIADILETAKPGDILIVSEISRLARSTLQVLEILELAAKNKVSVHIVKNGLVMDGSIQATITATVLGLAAQIEKEFISLRTKEALTRRKESGLPMGRPKGKAQTVKLDLERETIQKYLKKGISKRSIAKIVECSPTTLHSWIEREKVQRRKARSSNSVHGN